MKNPITISALCILLFAACSDSVEHETPLSGTMSFAVSVQDSDDGRRNDELIPSAVFISIKDTDDQVVYSLEKLSIVEINGSYTSAIIEIDTGSYTVEDFVIADSDNSAIYLTPKTGSEFEYLVSTPLSHEFMITSDEITTVEMDGISPTLG
jgi:hypothetical protein